MDFIQLLSTYGAWHHLHYIEMDSFLDGLIGDGRDPLKVCDGAGEADDFDLGCGCSNFSW